MIGKWLVLFGLIFVAVGAVLGLAESIGFSLARLPGDLRLGGKGWSLHVPIVTCILLSLVLTGLLNVVVWFLRR